MIVNGRIEKSKNRKIVDKSAGSGIDWTLVLIVTVLVVLGLIMQYSASNYDTRQVFQQSIIAACGMCMALTASFLPVAFWHKLSILAFIGSLGLCGLCRFIGSDQNMGAKRWIRFGPIGIQPSEFLKIGMILMLATIICKNINDINNEEEVKFIATVKNIKNIKKWELIKKHKGYILSLAVIIVSAGMVGLATKDLGTAIIIFGIGYIILIVISPRIKYLFWIAGFAFFGGGGLMVFLFSYRLNRILAWFNPDANTSGTAFQIRQGLYAIGSGGLFGRGLGKSIQKSIIPEAHTDMIFSIVCEELGIIGGCTVVALFIILILRLKKIYDEITDLYGKLVIIGVASHLAIQAFINMAVLTGICPNTGVPLPFISYGGSSLLSLLLEIGIVLSVRRASVKKGKKVFEVQ